MADAGLAGLPVADLRRMAAAADALLAVTREAAARGSTPILDLIGGRECEIGTHYPPDDVYDFDSGAGYYYHVHPPGPRSTAIGAQGPSGHGHFHLFVNRKALPAGIRPWKRPGRPVRGWGVLHLGAIAIGSNGVPTHLFTLNPHFSQEWLYPAQTVIGLFDRFRFADPAPPTRWVTAMTALFRPQFSQLLKQRDQVLAPLVGPPSRLAAGVEIASAMPIDIDAQIVAIDDAIASSSRPKPQRRTGEDVGQTGSVGA